MSESGARSRIGADVGGTFTDVVMRDAEGRLSFHKVLSTPPAYDLAVVGSVAHLLEGTDPAGRAAVGEVVHGTTVATNAVLERRGSRTALVTTAGFRDVLAMRRMRMPHLYDPFWTKPPSLVERHLRFELDERVMADGTVLRAVDAEEARELVGRIRASGVEAVAVCFLHAHRFPEHEERFLAILNGEWPEAVVSLSSAVLREQQEYERTAATTVNAYVRPLMARYLSDIRGGLDGLGVSAPLTIMQSSGGLMTARDAAERPVYALESGPAAGVVAARAFGAALGYDNVLSFDMGGTTAKASLIEGGRLSRSREYEVGAELSSSSRLLRGGGELIRIPTIDIAEVGAGGGSIAWIDAAGAFELGPRSAGADPGPACYGRGGREPTVTDANVFLGYIPTGALASGDLEVSLERAGEAIGRVAEPLGLSTLEAARGIREIANARMMRALRAVSSEKGRDPREFALIAFGGSGPLHAAALADELGIATAVIPPLAGLFSASGLLFARTEFQDVRPCRMRADAPDFDELRRLYRDMEARLVELIGAERPLEWQRTADVRYAGQNWDIEVEFPTELTARTLEGLVERFEAEHERLYSVRLEHGSPVELRALRLAVIGPPRETPPLRVGVAAGSGASRAVDFGEGYGQVETPVGSRASLGEEPMAGPVLIDEYDTTVVVPPWWTVSAGARGSLVLERARAATGPRDRLGGRGTAAGAVTAQLVANALATTADEMATTVFRTAHSAVVRDAMDFSAALVDPSGETVAQAVTIPLQLGSIPSAMATLLEHYAGDFHPGDVFLVNDPFDGASHNPDIFIAKPAFAPGRTLLGFAVTVAHHADIGGRVPGTIACDSTDVFQEGLRLPWLRLYDRGNPVGDVFKIIRANVRIPRMTLGDIGAQVAACHIGVRGIEDLAGRYGAEALVGLMSGLVDHTETLLRREIASWPDGTATFTDYLDSDGIDVTEVPITVTLTISGDRVSADFSESAPMVRGALNCTHSFTQAAVFQTIMAASSTSIPSTSGVGRPITVITKPGTVTDVLLPGASSMRGVTGYRICDVMNGALARLIPDRVSAAGEGGSTLAFFTGWSEGRQFVYSELVVGTWGARPGSDGNDGLANPCASIANIPIEVAESDWPILVERYGLVQDSGGAGEYRGGLAVERTWRALAPDTALQVRSDRQLHRPYGLNGGLEGGASANRIRRGGELTALPPMFGTVLQPGEAFHHRMPGGGGWGDPRTRDPAAVARDVLNENVSVEAARELYGVIVHPDGTLDEPATEELRLRLREPEPVAL